MMCTWLQGPQLITILGVIYHSLSLSLSQYIKMKSQGLVMNKAIVDIVGNCGNLLP